MKKLIAVALLAVPFTFAQTTPAPATDAPTTGKTAKKHAKKHGKKAAKADASTTTQTPAAK